MKIKCINFSMLGHYSMGKIYKVIDIDEGGYYKVNGDRGITWWCNPFNFIAIQNPKLSKNIKIL